jgi:hypothetical protein
MVSVQVPKCFFPESHSSQNSRWMSRNPAVGRPSRMQTMLSHSRTLNAIFPALMLMRIYAREWSLSLHSCAPQAERIFGSVQTQKFHMTPLRCLAGGAGEAARKRGTTFMIPPARDVLLLFFTSRAETYNHSLSGCVYTCAPHLKIHTLTSRRSHNRRLIMWTQSLLLRNFLAGKPWPIDPSLPQVYFKIRPKQRIKWYCIHKKLK